MLFSIWLLFFLPTVRADGWDDFSNNLATDLAPILSLFGEQITKQYLSESIYPIDYFIFALAPIGILTAVVSAIRVCGTPSLRAFIGRAQEGGGLAEAELCSSTSRDVCELYNNGGIARVFGRPKVLEVVHDLMDQDDAAAGIYKFRHYLKTKNGKREWESEGAENQEWSAPSPNLSLNVGIKRKSRVVFLAIAVLGSTLQVGVLAFAVVATYYLKWEKDGKRSESYACPLTIVGTILVFCGVFLCAYLIGSSTDEKLFNRKTTSSPAAKASTIYWVQPGGQVLGDQVFDPFCYSDDKQPLQQYVSSWKHKSNDSQLLVWLAVGTTVVGFALQFTGFRGMHSAVSVAQLAVMLVMSIARAALRMQRLKPEDNYLSKVPDMVTGHELDWLALRIGQADTGRNLFFKSTNNQPGPEERWIWRFRGIPDNEKGVSLDDGNKETKIAAKVLTYRTRLAGLSQEEKGLSEAASPAEHFSVEMVEVRGTARKLVSAIESAANMILTGERGVQKSPQGDVESVNWKFEYEMFLNVLVGKGAILEFRRNIGSLCLQFSRPAAGGPWSLQDSLTVEGLLGLWVWSLKSDPAVVVQDKESGIRISQATEISARRIISTEGNIVETGLKACLGGTVVRLAEEKLNASFPYCGSPNTIWLKGADGWNEASRDAPLQEKARFFGWHTTKLEGSQDPMSLTVWVTPTNTSLTTLCAQEVFGYFLKSMLALEKDSSNIEKGADQQHLTRESQLVSDLANIFVEEGLGSKQEALFCIAPLVMSPFNIAKTKEGVANARKTADQLRRQNEWLQAEALLRLAWNHCHESTNSGANESTLETEDSERTAIALGELYRMALAESGRTRAFGAEGIQWLSKQESLLDQNSQNPVKEVIRRYVNVAERVTAARMDRANNYKSLPSLKSDRNTALVRLTSSPPKGRQEQGEALCMAAQQGWVEVVLALLELEARPDFIDQTPDQMPVLSYAAQNKNIEIFNALLEKGAPPNIRDNHHRTPLTYAAEAGNITAVRLLLDHPELDENQEDDEADTPLWFAAYGGQPDVIEILAKLQGRNGDINAQNANGTSPLIAATKYKRHTAVRRLLDMGADSNAEDNRGGTALSYAAGMGNVTITEWLLDMPGIRH